MALEDYYNKLNNRKRKSLLKLIETLRGKDITAYIWDILFSREPSDFKIVIFGPDENYIEGLRELQKKGKLFYINDLSGAIQDPVDETDMELAEERFYFYFTPKEGAPDSYFDIMRNPHHETEEEFVRSNSKSDIFSAYKII